MGSQVRSGMRLGAWNDRGNLVGPRGAYIILDLVLKL